MIRNVAFTVFSTVSLTRGSVNISTFENMIQCSYFMQFIEVKSTSLSRWRPEEFKWECFSRVVFVFVAINRYCDK